MPEYCIESLFKIKIAIFDGLSGLHDQHIECFDQLQQILQSGNPQAFAFAQANCKKRNGIMERRRKSVAARKQKGSILPEKSGREGKGGDAASALKKRADA